MISAQLMEEVNGLDEKGLRELISLIHLKINQKIDATQQNCASKFSIDDGVSWVHNREKHFGKIIRCNPKSASIRETDARQTRWNVSWSLLEKTGG